MWGTRTIGHWLLVVIGIIDYEITITLVTITFLVENDRIKQCVSDESRVCVRLDVCVSSIPMVIDYVHDISPLNDVVKLHYAEKIDEGSSHE